MNLALWLKKNGFRADQVQTFYPSPMATATAMYHTGLNPLKGISRDRAGRAEKVDIVRGEKRRRLHKAFLRYHDPNNWPLLREALKSHGPRRPDRQRQAPPDPDLPAGHRRQLPERAAQELDAGRASTKGRLLTQHTGLPPRETGAAPAPRSRRARPGKS